MAPHDHTTEDSLYRLLSQSRRNIKRSLGHCERETEYYPGEQPITGDRIALRLLSGSKIWPERIITRMVIHMALSLSDYHVPNTPVTAGFLSAIRQADEACHFRNCNDGSSLHRC